MKKLLSIIIKNFLIITYSKIFLLILILGPIFLMSILGFGLADNGIKNIPAIVYVEENTPFTESFIHELELASFIVKRTKSLDQCISEVKNSDQSICIELIKKEFALPGGIKITKEEVENAGIGYSVKLHADFSKPRIVWGIISKVNSVTEHFSERIRDTTGEKFQQKLSQYSNDLELQSENIEEYTAMLSFIDTDLDRIISSIPTESGATNITSSIYQIKVNINYIKNNIPEYANFLFSKLNFIEVEMTNIENIWIS